MKQDGHARYSLTRSLILSVGLWCMAGCITPQATHQGVGSSGMAGNGDAIAQSPECNQTDSTVSCCLKRNPGQYERCGAAVPTQTPKRAPKGDTEPVSPYPIALPQDRRARERKCREYYHQCIERGGEYEKRGHHGQTICQSCYDTCLGIGSWPAEVNDFECLGGH